MESVVIIVSPLSWSQSTALLLFYALGSVDVHILVYVMYKAKKKKHGRCWIIAAFYEQFLAFWNIESMEYILIVAERTQLILVNFV